MRKIHLRDPALAGPLENVSASSGGAKLPVLRDASASVKEFRTTIAQEKAAHPVQELQADRARQLEMKQYALGNLFGSHMPLRLQMEQYYLSRPLRLPGLRSEYSGLQTLLGDDEEFGFEDFLGDPEYSEVPVDIHAAMETRLFGRPL